MEYQLNPKNPWQYNGSLRDNGDETSSQPIRINPQIVGDKFGFIPSDPDRNVTKVIISNKGLDIDQIKIKCQEHAEEFCKQQYPDT